jgi:5-formyltetrahydrofolate cyclo-ligase
LEKSLIREFIKSELRKLTPADREARSTAICGKLGEVLSDRKKIGLFAPTETEPDLDILWKTSLAQNRLIAYPKCQGDHLQFCAVSSLSCLQPGKFGIREPDATRTVSDLHAVVVPGMAFTKTGARVGRGAGLYDRFLQTQPGTLLKVGVCFSFQVLSELPREKHDVNVDLLVFD